MPGLQASSLVGGVQEANSQCFLSHTDVPLPLFLPPSLLSKNTYIHINKIFKKSLFETGIEDSWALTMGRGMTMGVGVWGRGEQQGKSWDNCNWKTIIKIKIKGIGMSSIFILFF